MLRFCLLFLPFHLLGQKTDPAALIRVEIAGLKSPGAILGYYFGGQAYKADSTAVDTLRGIFQFNTRGLKPGIMFVSADKGRLFNFILTKPDDSLSVRGTINRLDTLSVRGSAENIAYFELTRSTAPHEAKLQQKQSMYKMVSEATRNRDDLEPLEADIRKEFKTIDSLTQAYTRKFPGHLYVRMIKSLQTPEPPGNIARQVGGKTNPARFFWLQKHYFDNTDFHDERLLFNNLWPAHFDNYFNQFVPPQIDSFRAAIDRVIALAPKGGAFYRFMVRRITEKVEMNDEPGADVIFVHMVDRYHPRDDTPWLNAAVLEQLAYKADFIRPVLTGNIVPELILPDENGVMHDLRAVKAPVTMLIFYSPLCAHCMELMPDIYQTWLDFKPAGVEAVAVCSDKQYNYWKKFISQQNYLWTDLADPSGRNEFEKRFATFNLPVIYLLDENKRLLRKRVPLEKLKVVLAELLTKK